MSRLAVAPRWLRRTEHAPREVLWAWAGPPGFDIDHRRVLMTSLRAVMDTHAFELARVRSTFRRLVTAEGAAAVLHAEANERSADENGHWWIGNMVWTATDGSVIVCVADPDGFDLHFQGWGPFAEPCIDVVRQALADHRP